jgi:hypothetical protein
MNIEKKIWPENFEKIINEGKNFELRLADFDIQEGDNLILKEYNPNLKNYTGRMMVRTAYAVCKFYLEDVDLNQDEGLYACYTNEQLSKFGYYWIGI